MNHAIGRCSLGVSLLLTMMLGAAADEPKGPTAPDRAVSAAELASQTAPAGVYRARPVAASPALTAAGIAWWRDRLIIADRGGRQLLSFTPPDRFATFKRLTNPVGVAVDGDGDLIVTEKEKDVINRLVRIKADGSQQVVAEGEALGSPQFVTVHRSGTILWSGFPDGGTRSLRPGGEPQTHQPRIVHTYGIGLSPAHEWLYVSSKIPDKDRRAVWRFPVKPDGEVGMGEIFFRVQDLTPRLDDLPPARDGSPSLLGWVGRLQGLAVDRLGNLYIAGDESHTSGEAVAVIDPQGKQVLAMVLDVPRNISALAFGGPDGRTLFITGTGSYRLHHVRLPVAGAGWP